MPLKKRSQVTFKYAQHVTRLTAGLKHGSQVGSGHRSGHRSGQWGEYFSAKEIDYIFGVYKNLVLSRELIM